MSIPGNYPNPVWVNGYQCWNCTDVDNAKKHIDPDHPKSGPFNVDARSDPSRAFEPAVKLGGTLAEAAGGASGPTSASCRTCAQPPAPTAAPGRRLDLSV